MDTYSVAWKNFRGFARLTQIEFPALTLLIGRNNVGKSSAYAPLLMLRQTLDAPNREIGLLSQGDMIDAGTYLDYVTEHKAGRKIAFRLQIPEDDQWSDRVGCARPTRLDVDFDSPDGRFARLIRNSVVGADGEPIITRTRNPNSDMFSIVSSLIPSASSIGPSREKVAELYDIMRKEPPTGFLFDGIDAVTLPRNWRQDEVLWNSVRQYYNAAHDLTDVYDYTNTSVRNWLRQIAYVGPLRSLPQVTYRLSEEYPGDVGREGQHAPELLFRGRDSDLRGNTERWLDLLGYGSLDFEKIGDDHFQIFVNTPNRLRVNIAHSGVGLSQLLPLLVQGLSASPTALVIAQQPEIHLNPKQQSILTDFLIELSASGRRVVVETHSEHVLLRLRRRIAEGGVNASDVAVYYFDNVSGRVKVERVPLEEDGAIPRSAWPSGFFEDQLQDSFALAIAQSRRVAE